MLLIVAVYYRYEISVMAIFLRLEYIDAGINIVFAVAFHLLHAHSLQQISILQVRFLIL